MTTWCTNLLTVRGAVGDLAEFEVLVSHRRLDLDGRATVSYAGEDGEVFSLAALYPVPSAISAAGVAATFAWCAEHWGVVSDRCLNVYVERTEAGLAYNFDTPWAPPARWLEHVAAEHPWLRFELVYVEPETICCGMLRLVGGTLTERHELANDPVALSAFARRHLGWDAYQGTDEEGDEDDEANDDEPHGLFWEGADDAMEDE